MILDPILSLLIALQDERGSPVDQNPFASPYRCLDIIEYVAVDPRNCISQTNNRGRIHLSLTEPTTAEGYSLEPQYNVGTATPRL